MIEVHQLSKRYGDKLAVDGLSFVVHPGIVTGVLGPNGAQHRSGHLRLRRTVSRHPAADPLSPWTGLLAVMCAFAAVMVGVAAGRLQRVDA